MWSYEYCITAGSKIFGALECETDSLGNSVFYIHDLNNGNLEYQYHVSSNTGYCYTYDTFGRLTKIQPVANTGSNTLGSENVNYTYDSAGYLTSIGTDSTTYEMVYDSFGNSTGDGKVRIFTV